MSRQDDQERVIRRARAIRAGEAPATPSADAAFDQILAAHSERTFRLCRRIVRDDELAREVAQEALLTAWRGLPDLASDASFTAYVAGIARNLARNASRKKRETLSDDGVLDVADPTLDVLAALGAAERSAVFARVTEGLEPEEREAIHLRYVEGVPQDEIGPRMGRPDLDGRTLLQRCRRRLSRSLREELKALGHGSSFFRPG